MFGHLEVLLGIGLFMTCGASPLMNQDNTNYGFNEAPKSVLVRPITKYLVSEYNRITTTNDWLYKESGDPRLECKDDICEVLLLLFRTTCTRLSGQDGCPTRDDSETNKWCWASLNIKTGQVYHKLICVPENQPIQKNTDDVKDSELAKLWPLNASKKWGPYGGNPFPI